MAEPSQWPTATGLTPFCQIPDEYGSIKEMRVIGDGLCVITKEHKVLLISPEGNIAVVDPCEINRLPALTKKLK
jgi:hypothetical protein